MKKKHNIIRAVCLFTALITTGAVGAASPGGSGDLVIYAYDSFVAEWGPGPLVIPKFEEKYGVTVRIVSVGDAGSVLNRAILERERPKADILVGIDNNMLARALEEGVLQPYRSPNLDAVPDHLVFDRTGFITPFDYSYFAFVYDSQVLKDLPRTLEDLTDPRFKRKIILEDPRTSSPGLGFLLWTIAVYGDEFTDYWERLKPNLLTITDGWDTAYGMFTGGEAPMVLSYTTSPPYHLEYEQTERYKALIFDEGNYIQIEGMGIVKGAPHPDLARKFIDFILSEDFQEEIPVTNWMYPVTAGTRTPESFRLAPKANRSLQIPAADISENLDAWIDRWMRIAGR